MVRGPRRDDGVPLELNIEFAGNVSEEAQEAVSRAFEVATERISLDEDSDYRTMSVRVIASAASLGDGVLAVTETIDSQFNGLSYPNPLAEYLADRNMNDGFDAYITYSWRRPPAPWYYGLEEDCEGNDQVHFGAVMTHELGHGLGFFSRLVVEDNGQGRISMRPSIYDTFLVDEDGNYILDNYGEGEDLGEILTSDAVFWGDNIRIHAPEEWSSSSISHVHSGYYRGINELMTPFLREGDGFSWQAGPFFWRILAANGDGWPVTEEEEENRAPIVREEIADIEIDEDFGELQVVDLDDVFADPDEDALVFEILGEEVLNLNLHNETNILTLNPDHNFYTTEPLEVVVTASDREEEVTDTFLVTVNPVNDDPQWLEFPEENITVTEGEVIEFVLAAHDEVDNNTQLLIIIVDRGELPGEGQDFLEDNGQGLANFRWQTGLNHHGEYSPTFLVIDNEEGRSEEVTVTLVVRRFMVPPARPKW